MTLSFLDRVLLSLRLMRARKRSLSVRESELGAPLFVDGFDLDFPQGEAAYNAMGTDQQGVVWFAVSTKTLDAAARIFTFDGTVHRVADFAVKPGTIPQGKVHVDLIPFGEAMLGATHAGYYDPRSKVETPAQGHYPGGVFFTANRTGITPLAQAPAGQGIITMSLACGTSTVYALTWPSGLLLTLDLTTNTLRNLGPVMHGSRICRSIAIEPESGAAFWSRDDGTIVRFPNEPVATTPRKEMWRRMLWHPSHRVFYGALWNSAALIRFDPFSLQCEEIGALGGAPATLAIALDGDEIHALINGPGVLRDRDIQLASSVAYVRFDIGSRTKTASGPLRLRDGRRLTQSQSLILAGDARYALAWVESRKPPHRITPEHRVRGYAEEIVLVRF